MNDALHFLSENGILMQPGAEKVIEEHESPEKAARFIRDHYLNPGESVLVFPSRQELLDVLCEMPGEALPAPVSIASESVAQAVRMASHPSLTRMYASTALESAEGAPGVPSGKAIDVPSVESTEETVTMNGETHGDLSGETTVMLDEEPLDVLSGEATITVDRDTLDVPSDSATVVVGGEPSDVPSGDAMVAEEEEAPDGTEDPSRPHGMLRWRPTAREYSAQLEVNFDITTHSTCTGKLGDFVRYFTSRFESLREILKKQQRHVFDMLMPVATVKRQEHRFRDTFFQVIGIVRDVKITGKKNVLVDLEDDSGDIRVLVMQEVAERDGQIIPDEVLAVHGKMMPRTYRYPASIRAESIIRPDIPEQNRSRRAELPLYAAFMSDLHVGSNTFLDRQWDRFIRWVNGRLEYEREIAEGLKYLVIPGDVVDGIGVFPGQEEELAISDVLEQYREVARRLADVPEHIKIIISPGNHDAVRMAEPQPAFIPEVADIMKEILPESVLLGNPNRIRLHGVEVLTYHGKSMDDFVTTISHLNYDTPLEIMKEMLVRRHLVPVYGKKTPIAPEEKDYLVIDSVPDIFVTGHVHSAGIGSYREVLLLNASTWQDQTSYQKMMNFVPDYAKLPVVNLQTLGAKMLDFNGNVS